MFRLDDKTALVTGASQGIGSAVARGMADRGARVILAARNLARLEALAEEIRAAGGKAHAFELDLARTAEIPQRLEELKKLAPEWSEVDVLVNNAGITRDAIVARMRLDQWQEVLTTNLSAGYALTRALVRGMVRKRWGRILFVSSVVGLMGNVGQANYAASKAGIIGFAKSLAREVGGRNITANVIAPGFVETAMTAELKDEVRSQMAGDIVLGRFGSPADIAAAAIFLASDEASYITGEVLNVSGGLYM